MISVLKYLAWPATGDEAGRLLPALPVPGFLVAPREEKVVSMLLEKLCLNESGDSRFSQFLNSAHGNSV